VSEHVEAGEQPAEPPAGADAPLASDPPAAAAAASAGRDAHTPGAATAAAAAGADQGAAAGAPPAGHAGGAHEPGAPNGLPAVRPPLHPPAPAPAAAAAGAARGDAGAERSEGSGRSWRQALAPRGRSGSNPAHLSQLSMASSGMGDEDVDPEYVCAICLVRWRGN
jgi:hypothetical protein